ncbi:MAG: metal-dependent transcriptional regulator [Victivallales bacterium]|nr:metal-dependent transcriptional regulator [Victivallales bacterium]
MNARTSKNAMNLSESLEDYLEAIAELIAVEGHAHTKDIAEKLNVKMPSVTGAIRQLKALNYIIYNSHCPVMLTAEGKAIAEDVMHRHKVLKEFFAEVLGLPVAKASDAACHIEHVVDGDAIRRFVIFSEAIEHRSDAEKLRTYLSEAMSNLETTGEVELAVLSEFKVGDTLEVKRFGRNLSDTAKIGVSIGDRLTIEGVSLDKTSLRLSRGGVPMELPISIAENIWVTPVQ